MFGWLKRKIEDDELKSSLSFAFERIREDLKVQRRFLNELHESHAGFRDKTASNHQRISDWIVYFEKSIKRLEADLVVLESKVITEIDARFADVSKKLEISLAQQKEELKQLQAQIKQDVEVFSTQSKLKTQITNVDNVNNVNNIMPDDSFEALSNPERWLVGILFNLENPASYHQIAEKTGKTISTVRVYMNQLKIKGFVEESSLPNGVKIFSLKHKAKVKKLYNL